MLQRIFVGMSGGVMCVSGGGGWRKFLTNCCPKEMFLNSSPYLIPLRLKYVLNKGVKGIRSRKSFYETNSKISKNEEEIEGDSIWSRDLNMDENEYEAVAHGAMNITRRGHISHNVLIIQPYIKWGRGKEFEVTPDDELKEAEALIGSLPNWKVASAMKVPVDSLERKILFGKGKLEELKLLVQEFRREKNMAISCLFISKSTLSWAQKCALEAIFHVPVMDRYSIVIQILRLHATSAEARLQVAMAELPYIWSQAKDSNTSKSTRIGYTLTDTQREIIKSRERKLKQQLNQIRSQRKLLRKKRQQDQLPIVSVIGYTNAGKTSLIKALTMEEQLQPKDQLFATLDVTAHAGHLPSNLQVIYMDTVGFMRNLPSGLMECFVATLEDALLADLILHVQDISHPNHHLQSEHVENTLKMLKRNMEKLDDDDDDTLAGERTIWKSPPILRVANKMDLLKREQDQNQYQDLEKSKELQETHKPWNKCINISCKNGSGLQELLQAIEDSILMVTGRRKLTIRVQQGGEEMAWLYKNCAIVKLTPDPKSLEYLLMQVIITEPVFTQFKRNFC